MEHTHADSQTDLRDYLLILRRRKWSIGLVAGLVLLSALFFSFRPTAVYAREARVVLLPTGTSPIVQPDLDTERGIADSAAVAAIVMQNLHLSGSPQHLLHPLTVSVETNTNILDVHYADPRPATSQRMAQGFADAYLQYKRRQALDQVQGQATAIQQQIDSTTSRLAEIEHQLTNTNNSA